MVRAMGMPPDKAENSGDFGKDPQKKDPTGVFQTSVNGHDCCTAFQETVSKPQRKTSGKMDSLPALTLPDDGVSGAQAVINGCALKRSKRARLLLSCIKKDRWNLPAAKKK